MALNKESMLSAEYTSLRTEILQRISTRYTLINFSLLAFAAILGFQKVVLVLLYTVIASFLSGMYASNERDIRMCVKYIRQNIESFVRDTDMQTQSQKQPNDHGYVGWYYFRSRSYMEQSMKQFSPTIFEVAWGRFLFVVTELIAFGAAWSIQKPDFSSHFITALNGLYLVALLFIAITLILGSRLQR